MVDYTELGRRIRKQRQLMNKTQKEIADMINVAPSYYSNIERGLRIPSVETLVAIANALNTGLDMLLVDSLVNAQPRRSDEEMRVIRHYLREEMARMDYSCFDELHANDPRTEDDDGAPYEPQPFPTLK